MGKDKRTYKSKGVTLFSFSKTNRGTEFDVIYQIAAANMARNLLGGRRISKRAKSAEEVFHEYFNGLENAEKKGSRN